MYGPHLNASGWAQGAQPGVLLDNVDMHAMLDQHVAGRVRRHQRGVTVHVQGRSVDRLLRTRGGNVTCTDEPGSAEPATVSVPLALGFVVIAVGAAGATVSANVVVVAAD